MDEFCLIISGGEFSPPPEELRAANYIIACDAGYRHAQRLGLVPDLIVGDFDSAPPPVTDIPVERFPSRKDDTDTMLAARRALARGAKRVAICCAFGGRLDHTLANLQTAAFLATHGVCVRLVGTDTDATVLTGGSLRIPRRDGWSLSLFSLSERCEGVAIRGAEYGGDGMTLEGRLPMGVSNVWASDAAEIEVQSGILLVMLSRLAPGEHI